MRKGITFAALFAAAGLFALTGCGEKSTGDKVDDAVEDAGDHGDHADDASEAVDHAADDAKKALEGK